MSEPLHTKTVTEISRALRAREISVQDVWNTFHSRAQKDSLNAYLEVFDADTEAIAQAQKRIDAEKESAPLLCGIPIAVKDNILIKGKNASASSKILEPYIVTYDATVTVKLKADNALFLGRTNTDEFALGGSTENSAFGVTRNPYDTTRVAGGTSGGSAAAVAARLAPLALGTDTGGSVRNPASYCGIAGLKPTYGSVSRFGVIAAVSSFDQVGPMAHTIEDIKILFNTISGKDPYDATSRDTEPVSVGIKTIGIPEPFITEHIPSGSADVHARFKEAIATLEHAGYRVEHIALPFVREALAAYYIINFAEVSTNLARFDGIRYGAQKEGENLLETYIQSRSEGFGPETTRRILLGTYVLSAGYIDAFYRKANALRSSLRNAYRDAFSKCDVIAMPTMPTPAFKIGEHSDPMSLYLEDVFTVMANLTGLPALSVPMGTVEREGKELPVGIQFMAPHGGEDRLFTIGARVTGEVS